MAANILNFDSRLCFFPPLFSSKTNQPFLISSSRIQNPTYPCKSKWLQKNITFSQMQIRAQQSQHNNLAETSRSGLQRKLYDVFLSFRGADTRKGFTDHLYHRLVDANIHTYKDDVEMEYGQEIGPACLKAIEESKFCIIVFSKDFASSTWCLEEVEYIVKSKKPEEIRSVFYDVDPYDVEYQTGSFREAFEKHTKYFRNDMEKVMRWRKALSAVANLKALIHQNCEDGHEARNIRNIVKEIWNKLGRVKIKVAMHPVNLDRPAKEVIKLLGKFSGDIRIVSIYGMGGIGKTTIAKEVYNCIEDKFEASSFLENISEKLTQDRNFVVELQSRLLLDILKVKFEKVSIDSRGLSIIEERLQGIKLLIVLDGVDEVGHLQQIVGTCEWLSPGSRVVITTRIKDFPNLTTTPCKQYKVKGLDYEKSLELLCLHAFGETQPPKTYADCAQKLLLYAGGIPLALTILGSSLRGQNVDVWNNRLEKLRIITDKDIQNVLETSYHSLDDMDKPLFLDIACFFVDQEMSYVVDILKECGRFPIDGINNLVKRCLVSIGPKNELIMHQLIRDMGRDIVRQESPIPGKRTRIWHFDDAIEVLQDEMGEIEVEGLIIDRKISLDIPIRAESFKRMKRLKLLQLNYVSIEGSFRYISKNLRWLCWRGFTLDSIPDDLYLGNMVYLDMRYSNLKVFPQTLKVMSKLKYLDLSFSQRLSQTPDFSGTPNLKELILQGCVKLEEIDDSIEQLKHLDTLDCFGCEGLKRLGDIGKLMPLKLRLEGCRKLKKIDGNYKMETLILSSNIIEKFINNCDLFTQQSLPRMKVNVIDFITNIVHTSPIQTLYEGGIYNIFLPGNKIPSWFYHQNEGSEISSVEVPQMKKGSRIAGCIIGAILDTAVEHLYKFVSLIHPLMHVEYYTKSKLYWKGYKSRFAVFANETTQSIMWLSYWPLGKYIPKTDEIQNGIDIKEGDIMKVNIFTTVEIVVKYCGVHFVYEEEEDQNSLSDDIVGLSRECVDHSSCLSIQSDVEEVLLRKKDEFIVRCAPIGWRCKDFSWHAMELTNARMVGQLDQLDKLSLEMEIAIQNQNGR